MAPTRRPGWPTSTAPLWWSQNGQPTSVLGSRRMGSLIPPYQHPRTPPKLYELLSPYPIVSTLARYLTYRDMANLALANRTTYSLLHPSRSYFETIKKPCQGCSGHGMRFLRSPDLLRQRWQVISRTLLRWALFARCKVVRGRPCQKCGRETCRNCRFDPDFGVGYYGRGLWLYEEHRNRPIFHKRYRGEVVMAMCPGCEERTEEWVRRTYPKGRDVCDCNLNRRWICHGCRYEEEKAGLVYSRECVLGWSRTWTRSMLPDMQSTIFSAFKLKPPTPELWPTPPRTLRNWPLKGVTSAVKRSPTFRSWISLLTPRQFFCQCHGYVPATTPLRCAWCKRRHNPKVIRVFEDGRTEF
jgi:hypothetical protein